MISNCLCDGKANAAALKGPLTGQRVIQILPKETTAIFVIRKKSSIIAMLQGSTGGLKHVKFT